MNRYNMPNALNIKNIPFFAKKYFIIHKAKTANLLIH